MITGRTNTVAVVILDIRNPHFTGIVKGANRKAQELGYNLLFVDTGERQSGEAGLLRELSRRVDGLIVSSRMPDADLSTLSQLDKPVVFFCSTGARSGEAYDTVKLLREDVKAVFLDADIKFAGDGRYTMVQK